MNKVIFSSFDTQQNNSLIDNCFPDAIELQLFQIFSEMMRLFGCSYLLLVYESRIHSNSRFIFSTNPDWRKEFVDNNLVKDCCLAAEFYRRFNNLQVNQTIIPWYTIHPQNYAQRKVIIERREHNIGEGLNFCRRIGLVNEVIGLGAELNNCDFTHCVLLNLSSINYYILKLRSVALAYLHAEKFFTNTKISVQ